MLEVPIAVCGLFGGLGLEGASLISRYRLVVGDMGDTNLRLICIRISSLVIKLRKGTY